ncbi:STAS domain-containing protein [Planctellipticum variicoloris]|uniref:STAS domain-containing protein n=1 Tax=Planctellipticum variicoloris TaxID=3064265 RepID=UPI00301346A9|nr:STAS domain-containing protein [Planctomycetaceae bacterium SH412]
MTLADFRPTYFHVESQDDCVVVTFHAAKLSEDDNLELLNQEMQALIDQYQVRLLVVNLATVEYLTSAVLAKLITLHRRLHRKEGHLAICGVKDVVDDVFRASRLDEYFTMADDVPAAVARLSLH